MADNLKPVIRIEDDEIARSWKWEKNRGKINPNMEIMSKDDMPMYVKKNHLQFPKNVKSGDILMQNPYDEHQYFLLDGNTEMNLYQAKAQCIVEIAGLLGLDFKWEIELQEMNERKCSSETGIEYKESKLKADVKREEIEKVKKKLQISSGLRRNENCTKSYEEAYNEANMLMEKYQLNEDLKGLLINCDPANPFNLNTYSISVELSQEYNKMCDVAISLNVLKDVFNLTETVKTTLKTSKSFLLKMDFTHVN